MWQLKWTCVRDLSVVSLGFAMLAAGSALAQSASATTPSAREAARQPLAGAGDPGFGNPAGMAPETPDVYQARPTKEHPNTADAIFAHEAAIGGLAEVNAGKLAASRAQSNAVKQFANQMVADHSKANDKLVDLGKADHSAVNTGLDKDHQTEIDQLQKLNGKAFDEVYIRNQVADHQKTAQLYEWIIDNGQDPRLKSYAMDTLPVVLRHLEMAKAVQAELTGSAP